MVIFIKVYQIKMICYKKWIFLLLHNEYGDAVSQIIFRDVA